MYSTFIHVLLVQVQHLYVHVVLCYQCTIIQILFPFIDLVLLFFFTVRDDLSTTTDNI